MAAGLVRRSTRNVRQSSRAAVPSEQVPAPAEVDERVRLDLAPGLGAVAAACRRSARPPPRGRPSRSRSGPAGRRSGRRPGSDHGRRAERAPRVGAACAGSTCSSLTRARTEVSSIPVDRRAGGRPQPDRDRDRLVVVEQQRRHRRPGRRAGSRRRARSATRPGSRARAVARCRGGRAHARPRAGRRARRPGQSRRACSSDSSARSRLEVPFMTVSHPRKLRTVTDLNRLDTRGDGGDRMRRS